MKFINERSTVIVVGVLVAILVVSGMVLGGNPVSLKDVQHDEAITYRIQDLTYSIDTYFESNEELPDSLSDLKGGAGDAAVGLEYTPDGDDTYTICATYKLSTDDIEKINGSPTYYPSDYYDEYYHDAGYYCHSLEVSEYSKPGPILYR